MLQGIQLCWLLWRILWFQDYGVAAPLLDELLEANRVYLPQFFT